MSSTEITDRTTCHTTACKFTTCPSFISVYTLWLFFSRQLTQQTSKFWFRRLNDRLNYLCVTPDDTFTISGLQGLRPTDMKRSIHYIQTAIFLSLNSSQSSSFVSLVQMCVLEFWCDWLHAALSQITSLYGDKLMTSVDQDFLNKCKLSGHRP